MRKCPYRVPPWAALALLFVVVTSGCTTQQTANSETMAVLDTVAWSPDGKQIAAGRNLFNILFLYDSTSLLRTSVLSGDQQDMWGRIRARSIAYSADGRYLAAAGIDNQVVIWDLGSNSTVHRLDNSQGTRLIAFSPKEDILAVAGPANSVTIRSIPDGRKLASLSHPAEVMSLAFSFDGELLATGSADHIARIWRVADATLSAQLPPHSYPVTSVAFSSDSATLATYAGTLMLWKPTRGAVKVELPKPDVRWVRTMQFAAFLSNIASISMGGGSGVYVPGGAASEKIGMERSVEDRLPVLFSKDGRFLAVMRFSPAFSGSAEILVFHLQTEKTISLSCNCFSMAFSPDGSKLISVGTKLIVWDPLTGMRLAEH
jgi:WD40 repeat protein